MPAPLRKLCHYRRAGLVLTITALVFVAACSASKQRKPVQKMTIEELLNSLVNDPNESVRIAAARQLGAARDPVAIAALTLALNDDSQRVRTAAALSLGNTGSQSAAEPLWATVNDHTQSTALRLVAARELANLGDARAAEPLIRALPNPAASAALLKLGQPSLPALIEALHAPATRQNASVVLMLMGTPAIEPMIGLVRNDKDKYARLAAASILAEAEDQRADAALNELLKDPGPDVVLASYRFLIRGGQPQSQARLIDALMRGGPREMAQDFISSGNPALKAAGERWATMRHDGLTIHSSDLPPVFWGGMDPAVRQLALFHFDRSLAGTNGATPVESSGVSFEPGRWGDAVSVAKGGVLKYRVAGNLRLDDGSIEMWISPKFDGTDPLYTQYNHALLLYHSPAGDQFLVSGNMSGNFYCGSVVKHKFAGAGGGSISTWKAGTWHHIAFTYSTGRVRQRFYVDGALISETGAAMPAPDPAGATFTIGSDPYGNWTAYRVDEVVLSSGEKSSASIRRDAFRRDPF